MGKEYHPDTSGTRLFSQENPDFTAKKPPGGHYSADTGDWDGQLANAELAALADNQPNLGAPHWPGIIQRMEWTRDIIRAHRLPPPQAAVLNEIAFRDGRGLGCTATIATIALDHRIRGQGH